MEAEQVLFDNFVYNGESKDRELILIANSLMDHSNTRGSTPSHARDLATKVLNQNNNESQENTDAENENSIP